MRTRQGRRRREAQRGVERTGRTTLKEGEAAEGDTERRVVEGGQEAEKGTGVCHVRGGLTRKEKWGKEKEEERQKSEERKEEVEGQGTEGGGGGGE